MTPPNNGGVIPIAEVDIVNPKIAEHSNLDTLNLENNVFTQPLLIILPTV